MAKSKQGQIKSGAKLYRFITFDRSQVDIEKRTVEISFSSEEPYERWWGVEILDHAKGAMRTERLASGTAPLLLNHDRDDQIGVIEKLLSSEGKGRALVRFSRSAHGEEIMQDVIDGIRSCVSVGYIVHKAVLEKEEDGVGTYRIIDWEPFENSIVSIPADMTVGVGRGLDTRSQIEFITTEENAMDKTQEQLATVTNRAAESTTPTINVEQVQNAARDSERKRVADITAAGDAFKDYSGAELAREFVSSGKSIGEFHAAMQERVAGKSNTPLKNTDIGMSNKEARSFSFIRVLNALSNPHDQRARDAAKFEFECSDAAAKAAGKAAQGCMVPGEVLRRELTVGNAASAGNLVADNLMSQDFITMLRNAMMLPKLGVRTMTGLVGDVAIPRQTGGATAYWVGESQDVTDSDPTTDQIKLSPHTLGAWTNISRKLLIQSSIDVELFVRKEIAETIALAIDRAGVIGSGSGNEPLGVANTTGVGLVSAGTNGGVPTWANIVELESSIAIANALAENMAYVTNARVRGKLKTTLKDAAVSGYIWADGATPVNGYRAEVSNTIPSNGTKGTGTNLSTILFGNWADLIIAMWSGLDLTVDPYTKATSGTVRVIGLQDVDVAVRHSESFAMMNDVITA